jgi:hypothetical protein
MGLIGAFTPDKMKAALLILAVPCPSTARRVPSRQFLPWRAQMHQRLQKLENQPHAAPSPGPIQAPAPQPIHIYLPSQPANPPLQTFPIQGHPQQSFPIQGQPKQDLPIQGQPKQDFPLPGLPSLGCRFPQHLQQSPEGRCFAKDHFAHFSEDSRRSCVPLPRSSRW